VQARPGRTATVVGVHEDRRVGADVAHADPAIGGADHELAVDAEAADQAVHRRRDHDRVHRLGGADEDLEDRRVGGRERVEGAPQLAVADDPRDGAVAPPLAGGLQLVAEGEHGR
jgi:hypothetical protein